MAKRLDIKPGDRYGRFTIVQEVEKRNEKRYFLCKCDCGNTRIERLVAIRAGEVKSCGCLKQETDRENIKKYIMSHPNYSEHDSYYKKMYGNWHDMKQRCQNQNSRAYKWYGGRGIRVCQEWQKFRPFMEWALSNGWEEYLTIERNDVNGHYEPSNCSWIPRNKQSCNTRRSRFITHEGQTMILKHWEQQLGVKRELLRRRLDKGWSIERTFNTPLQLKYSHRKVVI